ncbi:MAG TPA: hypothetical protein VEP89_12040 [Draconibacterium sp.]|nr:hypothetical protein [Draconibacterium sp.]
MKTKNLFILIALLIGMSNCKKEEFLPQSINFFSDEQLSNVIVEYEEIVSYDSLNYIFTIEDEAWERIDKEIKQAQPANSFNLFIALDDERIYKANYIPMYYSFTITDIIAFFLEKPNYIHIKLGYPPGTIPESIFTGEDLRNDIRLIEQLKKDNKLIKN